jgi:hypothetical protein
LTAAQPCVPSAGPSAPLAAADTLRVAASSALHLAPPSTATCVLCEQPVASPPLPQGRAHHNRKSRGLAPASGDARPALARVTPGPTEGTLDNPPGSAGAGAALPARRTREVWGRCTVGGGEAGAGEDLARSVGRSARPERHRIDAAPRESIPRQKESKGERWPRRRARRNRTRAAVFRGHGRRSRRCS